MDTIIRPPATEAHPTIAPRRRWPRVLILVVVGIVAILLTVGSIWIANYMPLVPGSHVYGPMDERMRVIDVDGFGVWGRIIEMPAAGPTRFRYRFSIANDGPVAVRIDGIGPPASDQYDELSRTPVRFAAPNLAVRSDAAFERWHPFVLPPGRYAAIEMEVNFDPGNCLPRNIRYTAWPETVRFSVFGVSRVTTFESHLEVRIVGTGDC